MDAVKCVPFNSEWITSDKLDIHAIYRRPRMDQFRNRQTDASGVPLWDLTSGLPVRRHNDHAAKGFEYVSLATLADVIAAGATLRAMGFSLSDFEASYEAQGALDRRSFRCQAYLKDQTARDADADLKIAALVDEHGPDAVEASMRVHNPSYVLPERFRAEKPAGKPKAAKKTDGAPA